MEATRWTEAGFGSVFVWVCAKEGNSIIRKYPKYNLFDDASHRKRQKIRLLFSSLPM
jgi:hypothetical protein